MKSLKQHEEEKRKAYNKAFIAKPPNGIQCPACGDELVDSSPGCVLTIDPPAMYVECLACGFKGTRLE